MRAKNARSPKIVTTTIVTIMARYSLLLLSIMLIKIIHKVVARNVNPIIQ